MGVISKRFSAPAEDGSHDIQLAYQTQDLLRMLAGRLPTRAEIEALSAEKGLALSSQFLHRAVLASQPHGAFIRHVQATKPAPWPATEGLPPVEVVFVPSVSPGLRLRWGGHVDWMRGLAREIGFTTDVIGTSERESITGNARLIGECLRRTKAERVCLVTVGRGTAETRLLLQRRGRGARELEKVRAWISVGGSF